jgi:hypothetical protein
MESKSYQYLLEWTIGFFKNKDVIQKKIVSIEKGKYGYDIYIKFKDRNQYIKVMPKITEIDTVLQKMDNERYFTIVTLNSGENFDSILKNWTKMVNIKFLNIIFSNPFSNYDKKWIIFPYTHHKICDPASLNTGLGSMFGAVEEITEKEFAEKI